MDMFSGVPMNHFDASEVSWDDIHQTGKILELEGKKPNHSLIRMKFEAEGLATYDFLTELPGNVEPISWADHNPEPEVVMQIASWALHQSVEIRNQIFEFLESPSDPEATKIINALVKLGVIEAPTPTRRREVPLSDFILKELDRKRYLSIDDIYELEYLITSKRPRAALRQALRRLINTNRVMEDNFGRFYATGY
jgi:hypothetical protein